jgi:hypothetical protein
VRESWNILMAMRNRWELYLYVHEIYAVEAGVRGGYMTRIKE